MPENKFFITNRKGQKIAVILEAAAPQKGLAFVMHGLGGFKEQPHIEMFADAFRESGFTVVRFDTTNTLGESEGNYENATITSYYADLEDVIRWARTQPFYQEPFVLCGHSLGAICSALYAERHPEEVQALAPVSVVVSGKLSIEAWEKMRSEKLKRWKETGWREEMSNSKPGVMRRLPWSHMEDRLDYDLLPEASKLTMPVLLVVGETDDGTPPEHVRILFDVLPGQKEMHVIKGAPHTFKDPKHLEEIRNILLKWIGSFAK